MTSNPLFHHATIDQAARVFVIAEIGVNHDGDVDRALQLVESAAGTGVDAVKFQCFDPRHLLSNQAVLAMYQYDSETDVFEMLERLQIGVDELGRCAELAHRLGLKFVVTPFSVADVAVIEALPVDIVKIASPDAVNVPLLRAAAGLNKPIVISTGTASLDELDIASGYAQRSGGAMLQCVSRYPTPVADAALGGIMAMRAHFPDMAIGYSDHTPSETTGALAVAAGACVIEKHLTYDRAAAGPDHSASSDPAQLAAYVSHVHAAVETMGRISKAVAEDERNVRHTSRQSVCALRDLPAGHVLSAEDLTVKRPGSGIVAARFDEVLGRTLSRAVVANDLLHDEDLAG